MKTMNKKADLPDARDAAQAADLLVTVAETLNARLAVTAEELARSQAMLREASDELMTAFRGAAGRSLPQSASTNVSVGTRRDQIIGL